MKNPLRALARVLLVLVMAVGLVLVYGRYRRLQEPPRAGGDAAARLTYAMTVRGEAKLGTLAAAEDVLLREDGSLLGRMNASPRIAPHQLEVTAEDGSILLVDSTEEYRLVGELTVQGRFGDHGFFLPNGKHLAVNQPLDVRMNGLNATIFVLAIDVF